MLESEIKRKCSKQLEVWGWLVVHIIRTNKNGWPDTQILRKGVTYYIEFKRPGKDAEPLQKYRHDEIRKQGFKVFLIDSTAEIYQFR